MSRVDEALRRQNEHTQLGVGEDISSTTAPVDISALAAEPFPIEIAERRRTRELDRSPDSPIAARAAAPSIAPTAQSHIATPAPAVQPFKWFEHVSATLAEKIVVDTNMMPASREQYRRLAATLHHAKLETGLKVIMITSAVAGEGKTLTASNLALTFSESYGRSVLLIDADLRRPSLHSVFTLGPGTGLYEGLTASEPKRVRVRRVSERLSVLPAGAPTADPMAGLTSERLRHLVDEARDTFDWVIIDTPPLALLPDAHLLTSVVDRAVLVVRADSTPYELVKRAVDTIGRDRMIGVVLNGATRATNDDLYGYGYNYEGSSNYYTAAVNESVQK